MAWQAKESNLKWATYNNNNNNQKTPTGFENG